MKKAILWFAIGEMFIVPLILYQHRLGALRALVVLGAGVSCFMGFKMLEEARRSENRKERSVATWLVVAMVLAAVAGAGVQLWPKIEALIR